MRIQMGKPLRGASRDEAVDHLSIDCAKHEWERTKPSANRLRSLPLHNYHVLARPLKADMGGSHLLARYGLRMTQAPTLPTCDIVAQCDTAMLSRPSMLDAFLSEVTIGQFRAGIIAARLSRSTSAVQSPPSWIARSCWLVNSTLHRL